MITITLLGSIVVASNVHPTGANGILGLVKGYGPGIGSAQPYEPVGPWVDGVLVPQFLINQASEWSALKDGNIDLYDSPLTPSQIAEYNSNACVAAPDAPLGIAPCGVGLAPIQHEITLQGVQNFGKFEIDLQNAAFPTNQLAFRQAVALATDKEQFIRDVLGGDGAPNYAVVGCPALCGPGADGVFGTADDLWVKPTLNEAGLTCLSVVGTPMPFTAGGNCAAPAGTIDPARVAAANALLDSLGFASRDSLGFRLDNGVGCASRVVPNGQGSLITVNNCGKELQPVFYVRHDDSNRESLGFQVQAVLQSSLGIDMDLGGATKYPGDFQNFIDVNRRALFTPVFGNFAFNLYTGGWGLNADPTYIDDLYDSQFIRPFLTNYPNYNDALFNGFARGLRSAQAGPPSDFFANARSLAFAAEQEFNDTVAIVDVWTDIGPLGYRTYHLDSDPMLNGLRWEGVQNQVGVGPDNRWTWLNAHLVGSPLHDPAHPVFMKWGWKTDLLDSPDPVDSGSAWNSWDRLALSLTHDTLNVKVADDAGFTGDSPWAASLPPPSPIITPVGGVCTFPNGETAPPDAPRNVCSVLSYQLRPDLTFAVSLDGKIPAIPVTANDIRFSILDAKNSPTSFLTPGYVHVQDVVVKSPTSFDVYERNAAVWARHDVGGTPIVSVQHWCVENTIGKGGNWGGATLANCLANPGTTGYVGTAATGWPDAGVNVLSSSSGHQLPGPPVGVDLGSYAFVYDSQLSFQVGGLATPDGPVLYRLRSDPYFTEISEGWHKFHRAGNVNWYCTATTPQPCSAGITAELPSLPSPDSVINVVDLAIVAVHFSEIDGTPSNPCASINGGSCPYGHAPWDLSGSASLPDGTVNIFDLARVGLHFGQSFLGGTDSGGGTVGTLPFYTGENIQGCLDSDWDGLCNTWETKGIDFNNDGIIDLNLPVLGANPQRRDLFVELDYMVAHNPDGTVNHSHKPDPNAINDVVNAFANAPLKNPDGSTGITFHVQVDDAINETTPLPMWTAFNALKNTYFGTAAERASPNSANILAAKRIAFHYSMWIHNYCDDSVIPCQFTSSSGLAELPGNDFVVALGSFTNMVGNRHEQAGTFMHELGHNLNLHHGGSDDNNCKPNYLSGMNYYFQFDDAIPPCGGALNPGVTNGFILDYSRSALPTLDENNLDETKGIGATAMITTLYYCPNGTVNSVVVGPGSQGIDWDCDGRVDAGVTVRVDINHDGNLGLLPGYNDWANIRLAILLGDNGI